MCQRLKQRDTRVSNVDDTPPTPRIVNDSSIYLTMEVSGVMHTDESVQWQLAERERGLCDLDCGKTGISSRPESS